MNTENADHPHTDILEQLARVFDPVAFDESVRRSTAQVSVIQWAARRKMARDSAEAILRPIAEAVDLCWKATPYGTTEDGDTHTYLVPKGTVHRLVGALQGIGVSASLRSPGLESSDEALDRLFTPTTDQTP